MNSLTTLSRAVSRHALSAVAAGIFATMLVPSQAKAEDPVFHVTIQDHKFSPDTVTIPANTRVRLIIQNADPTPEEFESHELKREKIIPGNSSAAIPIGPLKPGTYPFFGEFHEDTAKGKIVVK